MHQSLLEISSLDDNSYCSGRWSVRFGPVPGDIHRFFILLRLSSKASHLLQAPLPYRSLQRLFQSAVRFLRRQRFYPLGALRECFLEVPLHQSAFLASRPSRYATAVWMRQRLPLQRGLYNAPSPTDSLWRSRLDRSHEIS